MRPLSYILLLTCLCFANSKAYHIPSLKAAVDHVKSKGLGGKKKTHINHEPPKNGTYPKYFHEPGGTLAQYHYDSRYYRYTLGYEDKGNTQVHLIRSYMEFFAKTKLETWIAHGTLLGWWWNGHQLPWDWDIDTQVSYDTMIHLGENYNDTKYTYESTTETEFNPAIGSHSPISRTYHLDVNPAAFTRHRGDGGNVIDARWIDTRNGLYIDITALAEIHPNEQPGIWTCKNYHFYRTRDLWPMRETTFEGVTTKVPYAYTRMLTEEYGDASLVINEFQGHKWNMLDAVWEKKPRSRKHKEVVDESSERRKKVQEKADQYKEDTENARKELYRQDELDEKKRVHNNIDAKEKEEEALKEALNAENMKTGSGNGVVIKLE